MWGAESGQEMASSWGYGAWRGDRRHQMEREELAVDWKLELVAVPVTDVDRAKAFYTDKGSFVFFSDPDGNRWAVQQIPVRF